MLLLLRSAAVGSRWTRKSSREEEAVPRNLCLCRSTAGDSNQLESSLMDVIAERKNGRSEKCAAMVAGEWRCGITVHGRGAG